MKALMHRHVQKRVQAAPACRYVGSAIGPRAALIADLAPGIAMVIVGLGVIVGALTGALWL